MDAPRRPAYQDDRGEWHRFVTEDEAASLECEHRWLALGGFSGYLACQKCGQAVYMVMEFEYLTWGKQTLEGHV